MSGYIFLDTWVYSSLSDEDVRRRLARYIRANAYTVLVTSLVLVELYNRRWAEGGEKERGGLAVRFLSEVPSVVVDPPTVWKAECASHLEPLDHLPIELDLHELPVSVRAESLLRFLQADDFFISQGKDIRRWADQYDKAKADWPNEVQCILAQAHDQGYVPSAATDPKEARVMREQGLFSLDLRHADPSAIDSILSSRYSRRNVPESWRLTGVRTSSLCFWYWYVEEDPANRIRHAGSDFGDLCHASLFPYCKVLTTDRSMGRVLHRVRETAPSVSCEVVDRTELERYLNAFG